MHILITNDDGIRAPGIAALADAMESLGHVTVLAPDHNWSTTGHIRVMDRPMRVKEEEMLNGRIGYACSGSPSDCVAMGLRGFLDEPVDLVVSGINDGENVAQDLTYSGTVSAPWKPSSGVSRRSPSPFIMTIPKVQRYCRIFRMLPIGLLTSSNIGRASSFQRELCSMSTFRECPKAR